MKILLDEQLDVRFKTELSQFDIHTPGELGWLGLKNGELRERLNDNGFGFFLSADKNLPFQQNFEKMRFCLGLLDTPSLLWPVQRLFVPKLVAFFESPPRTMPKVAFFGLPEISRGAKKAALQSLVGAEHFLEV